MSHEAYKLLKAIYSKPGHYVREDKFQPVSNPSYISELKHLGYLRLEIINSYYCYQITETGAAAIEEYERNRSSDRRAKHADIKSTISLIIAGAAFLLSLAVATGFLSA